MVAQRVRVVTQRMGVVLHCVRVSRQRVSVLRQMRRANRRRICTTGSTQRRAARTTLAEQHLLLHIRQHQTGARLPRRRGNSPQRRIRRISVQDWRAIQQQPARISRRPHRRNDRTGRNQTRRRI